MLKLLIITPTLGRSKYASQLQACLLTSCAEIQHVVVAPEAKVEAIRQKWSHSYVVQESDSSGGMYSALNDGLRAARSFSWDYFVYINDDDLLDIPAIVSSISTHPQADFLYGDYKYINEMGEPLFLASTCRKASFCLKVWKLGLTPFSQQAVVLKRNIVEKTGGFDPSFRYAGDMDFYVRAFLSSSNQVYVSRVLGRFRIHPNQLSSNRSLFDEEIRKCRQSKLPHLSYLEKCFYRSYFRISNCFRMLSRMKKMGLLRTSALFQSKL